MATANEFDKLRQPAKVVLDPDLLSMSTWPALRDYIETSFTERDRFYLEKFKSAEVVVNNAFVASEKAVTAAFAAAEKAVNAALASADKATSAALVAQEKGTAAAFASSEKAIAKAEEAQREYNVRSNEFRGQLDDQAKMLMPRAESLTLFKSVEEKLYLFDIAIKGLMPRLESMSMHKSTDDKATALFAAFDAKLESVKKNFDDSMALMRSDIGGLRESRSNISGRDQQTHSDQKQTNWNVSSIIAISIALVGWIISFMVLMSRTPVPVSIPGVTH